MNVHSVTIKDIARKLMLHHTTVSRALRNHPDVNSETRERILRTAKELNYQPNFFATSLRSQQSKTVGIIVPEISHDFFSSIVSIITNLAHHAGYSVMICQSNENYQQEIQDVAVLLAHRVAGIIACTSQFTQNSEHFKKIQKAGVPLVFFDRVCEDCYASKVRVDFYYGAFRVVEHLIISGYRRIAHITGPLALSGVRERLEGYQAALRSYGLPVDAGLIVNGGFLSEDGIRGVDQLLQSMPRPDAIFAVDDEVAMGAMLRIKEKGYHIPDHIGVAGFDNDKISMFVDPPLTTVDVRRTLIGRAAIALLFEQINRKTETEIKPGIERVQPELVVRKSTRRFWRE